MKYYKLLKDNEFIGVVSSNNFVSYSSIAGCFLRSDETKGEYISYNRQLYRSEWMAPIVKQKRFISVDVFEITEHEYEIYFTAMVNNVPVVVEEEVEEEPEVVEIPTTTDAMIKFMRSSKITEMSNKCRKAIEEGFDMEIRGEIKHFSLNTQDQLNLMSLGMMTQSQSMIPYHADGEEVIFYTAEEIQDIIDNANAYKIYNTTYFNALKSYINSLNTIEEIAAIDYGIDIPEEYQTDVLKALGR